MDVAIHIGPDPWGEDKFSPKWIGFLKDRGVHARPVDLLRPDAIDQVRGCAGVMWRWVHVEQDKQSAKNILFTIEHQLGLAVFPNSKTSWHYDEKTAQYYLLQALDAPTPQTWVFWKKSDAIHWASQAIYPVVFKLSVGASSSNVMMVRSEAAAINLINLSFDHGIFPLTIGEWERKSFIIRRRDFKPILRRIGDSISYLLYGSYPCLPNLWWKPEYGYAYFQEFIPANDCDIRVTVIGNRAFAFRRMNRNNDFRASGSGIIDYNRDSIDPQCISTAFDISRKGEFQCMAYDFLLKNGLPLVCEISYNFIDTAIHNCPGHWDSQLNWISGHMWPQEAQVDVLLSQIENRKT